MNEELEKLVEKAYSELKAAANKENSDNEAYCLKVNEAPCSICGKDKFVLKYRDVSGKTEGRISGS